MSLLQLQLYDSDDSDSSDGEDSDTLTVGKKRGRTDSSSAAHSFKRPRREEKARVSALPGLPVDILKMFNPSSDEESEDFTYTALRGKKAKAKNGRVRTFAHVEGNWPSHVLIEIHPSESMNLSVRHALSFFRKLVNEDMKSKDLDIELLGPYTDPDTAPPASTSAGGGDAPSCFHLSLSRTFILQHYRIQPFVDCLRQEIKREKSFMAGLQGSDIFVNDEKTRSFCGLMVTEGEDRVLSLIRAVDRVMSQFRKPVYYEHPRPHVSVASVNADLSKHICTERTKTGKEGKEDTDVPARHDGPVLMDIAVTNIVCNIGNKKFTIPLQ